MTYKINGVEITIQPTEGRWLPREQLGTDGNGHPVYAGRRQFEMRWDLISDAQSYQLQNFFDTVITTGSAVVELPKYAVSSYTFYGYTGCVLGEPTFGAYFTEHPTDVSLLVSRIRV